MRKINKTPWAPFNNRSFIQELIRVPHVQRCNAVKVGANEHSKKLCCKVDYHAFEYTSGAAAGDSRRGCRRASVFIRRSNNSHIRANKGNENSSIICDHKVWWISDSPYQRCELWPWAVSAILFIQDIDFLTIFLTSNYQKKIKKKYCSGNIYF